MHDRLEQLSPAGIGIGLSLDWLAAQCKAAIDNMTQKPRPGLNQQIPLPATTKFEAGFTTIIIEAMELEDPTPAEKGLRKYLKKSAAV